MSDAWGDSAVYVSFTPSRPSYPLTHEGAYDAVTTACDTTNSFPTRRCCTRRNAACEASPLSLFGVRFSSLSTTLRIPSQAWVRRSPRARIGRVRQLSSRLAQPSDAGRHRVRTLVTERRP